MTKYQLKPFFRQLHSTNALNNANKMVDVLVIKMRDQMKKMRIGNLVEG